MTVIIEYPEYNDAAAGLIKRIKGLDVSFSTNAEGKQIKIELPDIYYFENVERKLFIYTEKEVFRFDSKMTELEELTKDTPLVRVSRTCIMNTDHLKEIRQVRNSHLEALLDNGEMLIVSRKYLKDIKNVFGRR
ncbi:MAG: LytTR family transcriptional regulator DNA-binding domain-containing protein [Lachnospiraceae bacterium]|nr:LytTR family transcriptional regulator DNA-binding domain-containing protein [Lachnospiraceae bacterium]